MKYAIVIKEYNIIVCSIHSWGGDILVDWRERVRRLQT